MLNIKISKNSSTQLIHKLHSSSIVYTLKIIGVLSYIDVIWCSCHYVAQKYYDYTRCILP